MSYLEWTTPAPPNVEPVTDDVSGELFQPDDIVYFGEWNDKEGDVVWDIRAYAKYVTTLMVHEFKPYDHPTWLPPVPQELHAVARQLLEPK